MDLITKTMFERYEGVNYFSKAEYERRYRLVRSVMNDQGVDLLLILNASDWGYDLWLSGWTPAETIVVPPEGEILISHVHEFDTGLLGPGHREDITNVSEPSLNPYQAGLRYKEYLMDDEIAGIIARYSPKVIGLTNERELTFKLKTLIEDAVPGVKFKDITVELDYERIVKSEEELSAYRETARIQDELIDMFPAIMWAGRSLSDIVADMRRVILKTGAGINHLHFFGRGMTSIDFHGPEYRLKKGDFGAFMFEFSGPGNCALATMTPFVVGEPKPYDEAMYEACEKTNAYLCRIMKAGRSLADVGKEVQAYARSLGYDAPDQLTGHSTGYFYYERLSTEDDTIYLPLKENMLFGAPGFFADKNGNGLFGLSGLYGDPNTPFIWGTGGISVVGKDFSTPLMKSHEKLIQII